ncbi:hypothetical protein [Mesorhizobium kowhaii]|uniref:Uncharacterized protein n=1 Tax=Mesorhizobium kowhaii TaxID=1300272 RepID=A0A2W7BSY4_9HYPH|nr:hypothetical protein [Mesorhizobium kowhaii]PZV33111.1 hypothetical protein B5V02_37820 [Mesorhizobium kowhaii]
MTALRPISDVARAMAAQKGRNHDIGWAMTDSRRKADVILVKDGLRVRVKSACSNQDDWLLGNKL